MTVISWNVLAQDHVRQFYPRFFQTPSQRYAAVVELLHRWAADVLLLQGVDRQCMALFQSLLPQYRFFFSQRPQGKSDGLAIGVLTQFDVFSAQTRYFRKADGTAGTRLGQHLMINYNQNRLLLGNVHFSRDEGGDDCHSGIFEAKQYLAGLPLRLASGSIIAGDWNATVEHTLVQTVLSHGFVDVQTEKQPTCRVSGSPITMDHMFCSSSLASQNVSFVSFEASKAYPSEFFPSDHLPIGGRFNWC